MTQAFQNFQTSQESRQYITGLINQLIINGGNDYLKEILCLEHKSITRLPFNSGNQCEFNLVDAQITHRFDGLSNILVIRNEPFSYQFKSSKPFIANEYAEPHILFDVVFSRLILAMLNWNSSKVEMFFVRDKRQIEFSQDASSYMSENEEANEDVKEKWSLSKNIYDTTDKYFHTNIYGHRVPVYENEYLIAKILDSLDIRMDFVFEGMSNKIVLHLN